MLTRFVFIMMLVLAGWMPLQSVAAWFTMNQEQTMSSPSMDISSDNEMTSNSSCHFSSSNCDNSTMAMDGHHSMQCAYCASAYDGVAQLPEFLPQGSQRIQGSLPLYNDHIPLLLSPPPVTVIV